MGVHFVYRSYRIYVYSTISSGKRTILYLSAVTFADLRMITLALAGAGLINNFSGSVFSPSTVPHPQTYLILVFVFVDMFVLVVLYTYLFCYLQIQSKKLRSAQPTSYQSVGENVAYKLESGHAYKSLAKPLPALPGHQSEIRRVQSRTDQAPDRRLRKVSITLLCYPIIYLLFLMPLSVARLRQFAGLNPSLTFTYVAAAVFDC